MEGINLFYALGVVLGFVSLKVYEWQRLNPETAWDWKYLKGPAVAALLALVGGEVAIIYQGTVDPNGLNMLFLGLTTGMSAARIGRVEQKAKGDK